MTANLTARNARALLTFALPLLAAAAVHAQALWKPDHPVTLVVPYAAGGGTDATARAVSRQLAVLWGPPVVVENLPGADGLIGTRRVMDARPDGHTLLLQVPSLVLMKYTPGMKGIDPLARLEPVTAIAQAPNAFVVSSKLPVRTLPELFQYCRTSRKPCSVGAGENIGRMTGKRLAAESGAPDLIVVSYRGTAAIVQDLIAGNLDFAVTGITAALPHHRVGSLRIVATQGPRRAAVLPEVPTTAEVGSPQYDSVSWFGLFAPKGTSARITASIVAAVREALNDADVLKAVSAASAEPVANSPAEFAEWVRKEDKKLGALAQRYPIE